MMQGEDPETMTAGVTFPIGDGIELHLRYDEGFRASHGSHTILTATEILAGALATMYAKDQTYGGAWREQGWRGNLARIMSKVGRLRHMLWTAHPFDNVNEPVQDTLQDLINLAVFMTLNRNGGNEWGTMMADGSRS